MSEHNIYDICGRVKNHIAVEDIALSPIGTILVNYFTLFLKELYDFSSELDERDSSNLRCILKNNENLPLKVIQVSTPKEQECFTLYEQVQMARSNPQFKSTKEALDHFVNAYENLGQDYGMSGDDFWMQAEDSSPTTEDHKKIMRLQRSIQMCKYLLEKENDRS